MHALQVYVCVCVCASFETYIYAHFLKLSNSLIIIKIHTIAFIIIKLQNYTRTFYLVVYVLLFFCNITLFNSFRAAHAQYCFKTIDFYFWLAKTINIISTTNEKIVAFFDFNNCFQFITIYCFCL